MCTYSLCLYLYIHVYNYINMSVVNYSKNSYLLYYLRATKCTGELKEACLNGCRFLGV